MPREVHYYGDICPGGHGADPDLNSQPALQGADVPDATLTEKFHFPTQEQSPAEVTLHVHTAAEQLLAAARRIDATATYVTSVAAAMTSPPVAAALVAWLRDAAREALEVGPNPKAVALAQAIMGGAP